MCSTRDLGPFHTERRIHFSRGVPAHLQSHWLDIRLLPRSSSKSPVLRSHLGGSRMASWWPTGPENRPTGQGTPQRAQRRGWAMPAPTPGAQNGQPPRPPHGGRQQHHGGQYGLATRSGPSPGTQSPGLAPKPPRNGRQGLFRTQNRPKVPPGATMASQLPWQFNFSCNQLAISVHVDGTELLSTHWGRWAAPGPSACPPKSP